jgi:uncharacterized Zn-finger protein
MIKTHVNIFGDPIKGIDYQRRGNLVLQHFFRVYKNQLDIQDQDNSMSFNNDALVECQSAQGLIFYNILVPIWAHMLQHQQREIQKRHQVSLEHLGEALDKSRTAIRHWSESQPRQEDMVERYYGKNLFKCSRASCAFFYEGFESNDALERHTNRHMRPFTCPFEANCSLAQFGFATNRDRDRHIRIYHSDAAGGEGSVSQLDSQHNRDTPGDRPRAKFPCPHCEIGYTRNANLIAHVNSAHLGRRPHECSVCGRAFARKNDVRRHEKTKHTRK